MMAMQRGEPVSMEEIAKKYPPVVYGPLWAGVTATWQQEEPLEERTEYLSHADCHRHRLRLKKAMKLRRRKARAERWFRIATLGLVRRMRLKREAKKDRKRYAAVEKAAATKGLAAARAIMRPRWASDQEK